MSIYTKDWTKMRIAVFDTETTGLKPNEDRIVEFGLMFFEKGKPVDSYNRLINPDGKAMHPKAQAVHGITPEMLAKKKTFKQLAKKIRKQLKDCDVWCAYNESFDRSFLKHEFKRAGVKMPQKPVIDPLIMAQHLWPQGPNTLDAVCQRLRVSAPIDVLKEYNLYDEDGAKRHRAAYDALLTGYVLYMFSHRMSNKLKQALFVQNWQYHVWLAFTKNGNARYARALEPTLPPENNESD